MSTASCCVFFTNNANLFQTLVIDGITLRVYPMRRVDLTIGRVEFLKIEFPVDLNLPLLEKIDLLTACTAYPVLVLSC